MIKINGVNYKKGSGDYHFFGYYSAGNGIGDGEIRFCYYSSSNGNGFGDGECFGDKFGDGESWNPHSLKQEYQKYD